MFQVDIKGPQKMSGLGRVKTAFTLSSVWPDVFIRFKKNENCLDPSIHKMIICAYLLSVSQKIVSIKLIMSDDVMIKKKYHCDIITDN